MARTTAIQAPERADRRSEGQAGGPRSGTGQDACAPRCLLAWSDGGAASGGEIAPPLVQAHVQRQRLAGREGERALCPGQRLPRMAHESASVWRLRKGDEPVQLRPQHSWGSAIFPQASLALGARPTLSLPQCSRSCPYPGRLSGFYLHRGSKGWPQRDRPFSLTYITQEVASVGCSRGNRKARPNSQSSRHRTQ